MHTRKWVRVAMALGLAGQALLPAVAAPVQAAQAPDARVLPAQSVPATVQPLAGVEWLERQVLPAKLPDGSRLREVSGLAWDAARKELLAVSDRGRLLRWQVARVDGGLRLDFLSVVPVDRAAGKAIDAESLDIADGRTVVADEASGQLLWLDAQVQVQRRTPLPVAARGHFGVEAIAWHPLHGVLAVAQRPGKAAGVGREHRVVAEDGTQWLLDTTRDARIKAAHLLPGERLLLLEKHTPSTGAPRWTLRELALPTCRNRRCADAAVELPPLGGDIHDNHEGLACLDEALCLITNDDGGAPGGRTVLLSLRLTR